MGAAKLALWTRTRKLLPQDIHSVLYEKRRVVKTSAMRQTLHLLPADEFHIYMTALRRSRMSAMMNIMARIDVGPKEVQAMTSVLMKILGDEPVRQRELAEQVKPLISKKLQASMQLFWNNWPIFRPAIIEGLICYGPQRGSQATLARIDRWLPPLPQISEQKAQVIVLRKFLQAYGPAGIRDFCKWSGISVKEAKPVWDSLRDELIEVSVEGIQAFIPREYLRELESAKLPGPVVRLLPNFDPYMLAHADKDHLVQPRYYKRVYRSQGWLSPVILVDGRVVGIWSRDESRKRPLVRTEFFEKVPKTTASRIGEEVERLANFVTSVASASVD